MRSIRFNNENSSTAFPLRQRFSSRKSWTLSAIPHKKLLNNKEKRAFINNQSTYHSTPLFAFSANEGKRDQYREFLSKFLEIRLKNA